MATKEYVLIGGRSDGQTVQLDRTPYELFIPVKKEKDFISTDQRNEIEQYRLVRFNGFKLLFTVYIHEDWDADDALAALLLRYRNDRT